MKTANWLLTSLFIFLLIITESTHAERYRGSFDDSAPVKNAISQLSIYKDKFDNLLDMQSRIGKWKIELDKEHSRIGQEMQLLELDKQKLKQGKVSEADLRKKWTTTGRKEKIEMDEQIFQGSANSFNQHISSYNELAMELVKPLQKRKPNDVRILIKEMDELIQKLEYALANGNIGAANDLLKQSSLVKEFVE